MNAENCVQHHTNKKHEAFYKSKQEMPDPLPNNPSVWNIRRIGPSETVFEKETMLVNSLSPFPECFQHL